jgi:hypothetical protein
VRIAPGDDVKACLAAGVSKCILGKGVHRTSIHHDDAASITTKGGFVVEGEAGAVLVGIKPVPATGWRPTAGSPHIYTTTLPTDFLPTPASAIQQLFFDDEWAGVEARWPNLHVPATAAAAAATPSDASGGPLDPLTGSTTRLGTNLRAGVIATDPTLTTLADGSVRNCVCAYCRCLQLGLGRRLLAPLPSCITGLPPPPPPPPPPPSSSSSSFPPSPAWPGTLVGRWDCGSQRRVQIPDMGADHHSVQPYHVLVQQSV